MSAPANPSRRPGRPRSERARQAILRAAADLLLDEGTAHVSMDAVAERAGVSKATIYRWWPSKERLALDALLDWAATGSSPRDTGTLRGDLLAAYCGHGGISDPQAQSVLSAVVTAMGRDPEFAEVYRRDFIGPKVEASRCIYERARERGEVHPDVDLAIVAPALAGIVLHRAFLLGEAVTPELVGRVLDEVILPAALHGPVRPASS
jgi:AcrR family transcriptional regulator